MPCESALVEACETRPPPRCERQKVNFAVAAYPTQTFTGTVAAVEPAGTTTSNVVSYTVLISVDPTTVQLLPDMTATVTIITQVAAVS